MRDQLNNIQHASDRQEIEFLTVILHECHAFLQTWKVYIGNRETPTEDALLAITELERQVRERRSELAERVNMDIVPF
jgi:hypothetical protein